MEQEESVEALLGLPVGPANALVPALPAGQAAGLGPAAPVAPTTTRASAGAIGAGGYEESDLPEPTVALPPEVVLHSVCRSAYFTMKCTLDLKSIAFGARNAEYNPRKESALLLRLIKPRVTARITKCGAVTLCSSKITEEQARQVARKVTSIVQKCGHPGAKCCGFQINSFKARANLRFPVRLEKLAEKWRRHVLYEPEVTSSAFFYLRRPRCTIGISSGGKLGLSGMKSLEEAEEALRKTYPIFLEFSC
uniref:TATA box-binding protein-like 1 n=1 Tax=Pyrodinium bahamense TaxID=73915 RepID=A0A7S0ALB8_9DINO